ncbi:unnamed protein product [Sphagnum tenellum]
MGRCTTAMSTWNKYSLACNSIIINFRQLKLCHEPANECASRKDVYVLERSLKMATSQIEQNVDKRGEQDSEGVRAAASTSLVQPEKGAAEIVQEFYAAINRREIDTIGELFAEDSVYEDLVFPKPFSGRQAILEFFQKFMDSVGPELEFRIDDISSGDPSATGVVWHLEWRGKQFPFSKGCSFYRCDIIEGQRQIIYGRDAVEPATKPGDFTLIAIKGVAALLRQFPSLADRF